MLSLLLLTAAFSAQGRDLAPGTKHEIESLFSTLASSGCQFSRNGSWHAAGEAKEHLGRKYAYLLKKDLITTTESFVELAASKSSMSGKPYLVRCGKASPVPSRQWLLKQLRHIRAGAARGADTSSPPAIGRPDAPAA
ncbi:DUF5329 domain-containing protein [Lysobacter korlensis]|uniref:DUF5329 domain-containing protein n=1 Tax=Lysobacter korlensis TaxID=553636 RepID=A0ABV6RSL5_9GAMM